MTGGDISIERALAKIAALAAELDQMCDTCAEFIREIQRLSHHNAVLQTELSRERLKNEIERLAAGPTGARQEHHD